MSNIGEERKRVKAPKPLPKEAPVPSKAPARPSRKKVKVAA